MGVVLVGVKKFHSNKKDRDYFQLQLVIPGGQGEGKWVDNPFCEKSAYDMFKPEYSGKEVSIRYGYSGNQNPTIIGFDLIK